MSTPKPPLGKRESLKLEFKGRDALKDLSRIAREVVAMLNAEGGEVWVGLAEGAGAAVRVEPIDDPDMEARRLRDHLIDTIEPSPRDGEADVESVPAEGGAVLRVRVQSKGAHRPYAQMRKGEGRVFLARVDERVVAMGRKELEEAFRAGHSSRGQDDPIAHARQEVLDAREKARKASQGHLWLLIKPVGGSEVEIQSPELRELLRDPAATGNRVHGWNFAGGYEEPKRSRGMITHGYPSGPCVEVHRSGELGFHIPLPVLKHQQGGAREIWPLCLMEYTTSIFRLASVVHRGEALLRREAHTFLVDLVLFNVKGWVLRPYSPNTFGFTYSVQKPQPFPDDEFALEQLLAFPHQEMTQEPDRCAFRLLVRIYEAFGHDEDKIPKEFDRKTGRLVLAS
ncbi:MAG: ATP-binding protein [Planctomycetes bacterium]|nr:ATP-binding protein [Planctomycetota bacterium]